MRTSLHISPCYTQMTSAENFSLSTFKEPHPARTRMSLSGLPVVWLGACGPICRTVGGIWCVLCSFLLSIVAGKMPHSHSWLMGLAGHLRPIMTLSSKKNNLHFAPFTFSYPQPMQSINPFACHAEWDNHQMLLCWQNCKFIGKKIAKYVWFNFYIKYQIDVYIYISIYTYLNGTQWLKW